MQEKIIDYKKIATIYSNKGDAPNTILNYQKASEINPKDQAVLEILKKEL